MVEDKVVELSNLGLDEVGSIPTYHIFIQGVMAEWLMRGTVNTLFSGSNPLDAFYFCLSHKCISNLIFRQAKFNQI